MSGIQGKLCMLGHSMTELLSSFDMSVNLKGESPKCAS